MGQRANLIIIRNTAYELFYSHWCANTLPNDLFWGEAYALKFIEMQARVDESGWLDDVWAEGGAVLDLKRKKLILYGGEEIQYDIPLRNLYLKLMSNTWHGWDIQWAHRGIVDLATYVGYPKEKVVTGAKDDRNDISLAPPEEKNWVNTVASVKFSDNELLLFPLCAEVDVYLSYGPELIKNIDKSNGYKSISLDEWSMEFPTGGFHMDLGSKRLAFWHAHDMPNKPQELHLDWSDWEVIDHYSDYETQYICTNGMLKFKETSQHDLLEKLKRILLKESSNPLDTVEYFVKKESDAGRTVEMSPHALRYNGNELPMKVREEILNSAITS